MRYTAINDSGATKRRHARGSGKQPFRDRICIFVSILETLVDKNKKKTRIMFAANINYEQLRLYLPELMRMNLISYNAKTKDYGITEKGRLFLQTSYAIDAMLEDNKSLNE